MASFMDMFRSREGRAANMHGLRGAVGAVRKRNRMLRDL